MRHRFFVAVLAGLALCGLIACEEQPEAMADPCVQADPSKRDLGGSYVRRQVDTPSYALLKIAGDVRRNGRLSSIVIGDYTFDARIDRETEGAFTAARGSSAVPVPALTGVADDVVAYDLTYRPRFGPLFQGKAVLGPPTPPSQIAASGAASFSGPVLLEAVRLGSDAPGPTQKLTGQARIVVQYGTRRAIATITDLAGDGPLPFAQITWTGLRVCGARLVSTGQGAFQITAADGGRVNFAGASETSSDGAATFDSRFFGTRGAGLPTSVGGALLILGDTGALSAVFVANSEN